MKKISVNFLLGVSRNGFSSTDNKAATQIRDRLENAFVSVAQTKVIERMAEVEAMVYAAVEADLVKFARLCVTFFFSQQASTAKTRWAERAPARVIELNPTTLDKEMLPLVSSINDPNDIANPVSTPLQIVWPGLLGATIARKKRRGGPGSTTYFIQSGTLKEAARGELGDLFTTMFNPTVTITTVQDKKQIKKGVFQRGTRIGSIKVRLFADQNDAFAMREGLNGSWGTVQDRSIITKYLERSVALKLLNAASHQNAQRPWVGPAIAFWVLNRAPKVVDAAVRSALKPKAKRNFWGD